MQFSRYIAFAASLSWVVAVPAAHKFSVTQARRPRSQGLHQASVLRRHVNRKSAACDYEDTGTVPAYSKNDDTEFTGPVEIGGQQFNLLFDTGSGVDWVFGPSIPASTRGDRPAYAPARSSSARIYGGHRFDIGYANSMKVAGDVYNDTIVIGGISGPQSHIGVASQASAEFVNASFSGILGLAPPHSRSGYVPPLNTWFYQVMSTLEAPVFCASLKQNGVGTWDFGFIDSDKLSGKIHYTKGLMNDVWGFKSAGIEVGANPSARYPVASQPTYVDSGAAFILLLPDLVYSYYQYVAGASNLTMGDGTWTFPCDADLPTLSVETGSGYYAPIPGRLLNLTADVDRPGNCVGALQGIDGGGDQVFGAPLFKSQYVVHDAANFRIGFADQVDLYD